MATLPNRYDLGRGGTPRPSRPIITPNADTRYRSGQSAAALDDAGRSLQQVSNTVFATEERKKEERAALEYGHAQTAMLRADLESQSSFEKDQNYTTWEERHVAALTKARDTVAGTLTSQRARDRFQQDADEAIIRGQYRARSMARGREVDTGRARLTELGKINIDGALAATSDIDRDKYLRATFAAIEGALTAGFISEQEAVQRKIDVTTDFAERRLSMMPPRQQQALLTGNHPQIVSADIASAIAATGATSAEQDYLARTAAIESSGDAGAVHPTSGAAGPFQFIPSTAREFGLSDPFDVNASAQAALALRKRNESQLRSSLGRMPTDSELYLAHQQGPGGAAALLRNPTMNAVDALAIAVNGNRDVARARIVQNGGNTSMTAADFSGLWHEKYTRAPGIVGQTGAQSAGWLGAISPDRRAAKLEQVNRQVEAEDRSRRVDAAGSLQSRHRDELALRQAGQRVERPLTYADVLAASETPDEAAVEWRNIQNDMRVADQLYTVERMSIPAQERELAIARQRLNEAAGDQAGFANALQNYETLERAVSQNRNARRVEASDAVNARVKDEFALRQSGRPVENPLTFEQVAEASGSPEKAQAAWRSIQEDMRLADQLSALRGTGVDGQQQLLSDARSRLDVAAREGGFSEALANVEALQTAVQQSQDSLFKDPAAHVLRADTAVSAAWKAAGDDPTRTGDALSRSIAAQRAMGVPDNMVRPLTKGQAAGIVQRFDEAATVEEAFRVVSDATLGLGDDAMARRVLSQLEAEKLPAGVDMALERLRDGDDGAARKIISAIKVKPDKLPQLGDAVTAEIKAATNALYQDQTAAAVEGVVGQLTLQPAALDRAVRQRELMGRLVQMDVAAGNDASTAAENALETLYGGREAIIDPDDFGAVLLPAGEREAVLRPKFEAIRRNLDYSAMAPRREQFPVGGEGEGQFRVATMDYQQRAAEMLDGALWVQAGGGYALVSPTSGKAITGPDGRPRIWSLAEIKSADVGAPDSRPVNPALPGYDPFGTGGVR